MTNEIEILVRAIIQIRGKILVCRKIKKSYYFFPGGHMEFGESAKNALERELNEELDLKIKKCSFIGASEHLFTENGEKHHEINLTFDVSINELKLESKEDHIEFFLMGKNQIAKKKILPAVLAKAILKYLEDKRSFWVSQI